MKIEQQVGGSKPSQDAFTGDERQLTVDTDNWDLRLHDGVTPGGRMIINRDNADERYQFSSSELDGISGFRPEQRGFLTRLGAGNYRIRKLVVNDQQLTLANEDGYGGNPTIAIAPRIETDHTFGGDIIIEGVLQVDGGINGDTSGTHYGNVVGDVTGNVTGNLTGNASGNHTGSFTGDVDVTGQTLSLDDNQIATSKINGLEAFVVLHAVPMGFVGMWSGAVVDIPDGWYLCNGLNGTPDLRDRFIIGAGGISFSPGDTGGAATHTHATTISTDGSHTHTVTVADHALTIAEMPSHNHSSGICEDSDYATTMNRAPVAASPPTSNGIDKGGSGGVNEATSSFTGGGLGHSHTATSGSSGSHTHTLDNVSSSSYPPYYALAYIMRAP